MYSVHCTLYNDCTMYIVYCTLIIYIYIYIYIFFIKYKILKYNDPVKNYERSNTNSEIK